MRASRRSARPRSCCRRSRAPCPRAPTRRALRASPRTASTRRESAAGTGRCDRCPDGAGCPRRRARCTPRSHHLCAPRRSDRRTSSRRPPRRDASRAPGRDTPRCACRRRCRRCRTSVMPASSAAFTTSFVAASSIRPPKLLQPRPTTEASSLPMLRVSMPSVCRCPRRSRRTVRPRSLRRRRTGRNTGASDRPAAPAVDRPEPTVNHAITPPITASTAQMRSATATRPVSTAGGKRRVEMHERGEHRDREQPREPGRGVVHTRRDPELGVVDRARAPSR